jgi:hypothetical protein
MTVISPKTIGTVYKENKKLGRFIREQRFNVKDKGGLSEIDFRITYIKPHDTWIGDIEVNIVVAGKLKSCYWRLTNESLSLAEYGSRTSSRNRNKEIRRMARAELSRFLKYFGVKGYNISVGTIKVVDSL